LVECSRRARVDAEPAGAAVEIERRAALDLGGGDDRPEDDPGSVATGDEQGVLPVEPHPCARGALPVDVLILVHQHAVLPAQALAEPLQLRAELGVAVAPRVPGKAPLSRPDIGAGRVVGERCGDDRARSGQERLGVAAHLGVRHREPHPREEAAGAALADVPLGVRVRLGGCRPHGVEPELHGQATELRLLHTSGRYQCAAVRIRA
jgi:hypothetical protein